MNFYQPEQTFSPFVGIATQHHFKGRWVVVNNFFYELALKNQTFPSDAKPSDYDKINYLFTITYNLPNPKWSIFGEFQTFKNKIYSDDLFKFGVANLISKNSQIDLNIGGVLKLRQVILILILVFHKGLTGIEIFQKKKSRLKKSLIINSNKDENKKRLRKKVIKKV